MTTPSTPSPSRRSRFRAATALALALGVAAFALVLAVTDPPGPGLDPDAMAYLGAAVSLAYHGRYDVPMSEWASADTASPLTHFPPGFPTAIALPVRLGMSAPQAARLVVALSAFVTVALVAWIVGTATATWWAGALAAILLAATPALVDAHLSVLSEPLFLACLAGALALMSRPAAGRADELPAGTARLLALGTVAAAAALVRYAGIAVPAAAALWTLLVPTRGRSWRARVRDAALVALPAILFVGAWGARNALLASGGDPAAAAAPRARPPYLAGFADDLTLGAHTARDWLAPLVEPERLQSVVAVIAVALVVLLLAAALLRAAHARGDGNDGDVPTAVTRVIAAAGLLLAAYVGEVVASRLFVYGTIPFDERIFAPVIVLVEVVVATALGGWWRVRRERRGLRRAMSRAARGAAALAVLAWTIGSVMLTQQNLAWVLENGSDFAGPQWRQSALLQYVRTHAADRPLYSNWPPAIYFHLGRAAHDLPQSLDGPTLTAFGRRLSAQRGLVVAFTAPSPDVASPDSIARRLGLRRVARFDDGTAWESRAAAAATHGLQHSTRQARP
ncbi:MAG TPA: hypothetical protein VFJ74_01955 [Gemmatimonadaceae bacterium]|nr:hypothetical protein [Gemmatimonadaceae bacterium]